MKRLLFLLPVAAFFALIAAFVMGLRHDPSHITSTLINKPFAAVCAAGGARQSGPGER